MQRGLSLVVMAVVAAGGVGCGGLMPGGAGASGGGYVMPATSPYMWSSDLSDYKVGNWCKYKNEGAGYSSEQTIKVVGKSGDSTLVEVTTAAGGQEYTHLLAVQGDRKVAKAWYSGKDDKAWKKADVNHVDMPKAGKECGACKKEHKAGDVKYSDEKKSAGGKDVSCKKADATGYDCKGAEVKSTTWFSKEVPQLMAMGGKNEHGGLVGSEVAGNKMSLVGCGSDAKPKHELPKE